MSFIPKIVLLSSLAAVLSVPVMAQKAPQAMDARETPDEKGQTPSEIAADYARQSAAAVARQAREAQTLETRRQAISLPSDTDECLAYHRSERRCLVTVGEFNRRLASDTRWTGAMADSGSQSAQILKIRSKLLAAILAERYRDALVDNPGTAGSPAEEAWQAHLAGIAAAADDGKLRALFRKHADLFAPRREVQAEFLYASDSSFLDSLVGCMLDTTRAAGPQAKGAAGTRCAAGPVFQWAKPRPEELPEEWRTLSRRLSRGEISGIARCRFGWFVAAATRVTEVPGKTYAESRPLLAYMQGLTDPAAVSADSAHMRAAAGLRAGNPENREDPLVRVWLLPRAAAGKDRKLPSPAWKDTVLLGALRLRLSALPAEVGCEARSLLRRDSRALLKSRFGNWYVQAERNLPAAPNGEGKPCGDNPLARAPAPTLVSLAAEALAGKEREFKRGFLESQQPQQGSGEASGSAATAAFPPMEQWIAENVALEDKTLKRF